jgi:hypothetical protein
MSEKLPKMPELKPCPFCGGAVSLFASSDHSTAWEGGCGNEACKVQPQVWELTKEQAIAAWNRRSLQRDTWMRAMEVAARLVEPQYKRPCDCERCDCHNVDDAQAVAQWDERKSVAAAIRALPMPEGGE